MTISTADYQKMLTNLIEALSHFIAMTAQYDDNDILGAIEALYGVPNSNLTTDQRFKQRSLLSLVQCIRFEARKIFDADEVLKATQGRIDLRDNQPKYPYYQDFNTADGKVVRVRHDGPWSFDIVSTRAMTPEERRAAGLPGCNIPAMDCPVPQLEDGQLWRCPKCGTRWRGDDCGSRFIDDRPTIPATAYDRTIHGDPPGLPTPPGYEWAWRENGGFYWRSTLPATAPTPVGPIPVPSDPAPPLDDRATRPPRPAQACLEGWDWQWHPILGQWLSVRTVDESTKPPPR